MFINLFASVLMAELRGKINFEIPSKAERTAIILNRGVGRSTYIYVIRLLVLVQTVMTINFIENETSVLWACQKAEKVVEH